MKLKNNKLLKLVECVIKRDKKFVIKIFFDLNFLFENDNLYYNYKLKTMKIKTQLGIYKRKKQVSDLNSLTHLP